MKKRVKAILCLVLALLTLSLTGCQAIIQKLGLPPAVKSGEFVPALDTDRECTLTVVGSYRSFGALEAVFERFRQYYPNVELRYTYLKNYNSAILRALEEEEKPNLFFTSPWMQEKAVYYQLFESAEDLSDKALRLDLKCLRKGLLPAGSSGGVTMAPILSTTCGMLVNETLFEKLGIAVPTTFPELVQASDVFRAAKIYAPILGSLDPESGLPYTLAFPYLCGTLKGNGEAVNALNDYTPGAGEALRSALEIVLRFMDSGCVNKESCLALEDGNDKMLLRFLEGDVPMLVCGADIASGTLSRELQSAAYLKEPFRYSFRPIPVTDEGAWFESSVLVALSACKDCDNLDMTNEFLRFLLRPQELNELARERRLLTVTNDFSADEMFAAFGGVDEAHSVCSRTLGLQEHVITQFCRGAFAVAIGKLTVDEAVAAYGLMI